jgi:uncharacterized protein
MGANKFFQFLVPKDKKFGILFKKASENLKNAAALLNQLIRDYEEMKIDDLVKKIHETELEGDKITRMIYDEISKTFITPFDREDIHRLAKNIDDVVDLINRVGQDISLYKPKSLLNSFSEFTEIIQLCAIEIDDAMSYIGDMSEYNHLMSACTKISELESKADEINHKSIQNLFKKEKDPIELIKLKDILLSLERAVDRAERVADILKVVIVKMI